MPRIHLTERSLIGIKPPDASAVDYFDERLPGFGLRVTPHEATSPGSSCTGTAAASAA